MAFLINILSKRKSGRLPKRKIGYNLSKRGIQPKTRQISRVAITSEE
jgi:hypothetical protein